MLLDSDETRGAPCKSGEILVGEWLSLTSRSRRRTVACRCEILFCTTGWLFSSVLSDCDVMSIRVAYRAGRLRPWWVNFLDVYSTSNSNKQSVYLTVYSPLTSCAMYRIGPELRLIDYSWQTTHINAVYCATSSKKYFGQLRWTHVLVHIELSSKTLVLSG